VALHIDNPAYFDRLAEVEAAHWWSLGMWRLEKHWLMRVLGRRRGLRALDVGCGTGLTVARLQQLPQIDGAIGLEPSSAALEHARQQHVPIVRGSALDLPFADTCFDVVTCFDVFQHLPDGSEQLAASELRRVLRPRGIVLVRGNATGLAPHANRELSSYRLRDLTDILASSGLNICLASYANCLPALFQEVRGRLALRSRSESHHRSHPAGGGLRIAVPHPWRNRAMRLVSEAEAFLAGGLGVGLPFGHSTLVLAEKSNGISMWKET
jgi:SAM-dependent methyltransferase